MDKKMSTRDRGFRTAALILGVLGVPSLGLQVYQAWPLSKSEFYFFGTGAAVLYAFLSFGLGIGPMAPTYPQSKGEANEELE